MSSPDGPAPGRPSPDERGPVAPDEPLSALPSPLARLVAFVGILAGGLAGGIIGYSLVTIQCTGNCGLAAGLGLLVGALVAALGMAVVGVLGLRAMGEWHEVLDREAAGHAPASRLRRGGDGR